METAGSGCFCLNKNRDNINNNNNNNNIYNKNHNNDHDNNNDNDINAIKIMISITGLFITYTIATGIRPKFVSHDEFYILDRQKESLPLITKSQNVHTVFQFP